MRYWNASLLHTCESHHHDRRFIYQLIVSSHVQRRIESNNQLSWGRIKAVYLHKLKIPVGMRAGCRVKPGGPCCWYSRAARAAFSPVLSFSWAGIRPPDSDTAESLSCASAWSKYPLFHSTLMIKVCTHYKHLDLGTSNNIYLWLDNKRIMCTKTQTK